MAKQAPKLKPVRRQKCARVEGLAWLSFIVLTLFFGLYMTSKAIAEPSVYEAKTGQLHFKDDHGNYSSAIHLNSEVDLQINGMIAKAKLTQYFENTSSNWQEGTYVFPLPENAAVNYMEMQIGDRIIVGEIKEKNIAKKIYKAAKKAGKKASLIEQQRPNMFTQKVANIGPGERIAVTIHYLQRVEYDQGDFSLRFPMTLTPRYIPGAPLLADDHNPARPDEGLESEALSFNQLGWALPTLEVPDAHKITPFMTTNAKGSNTISLSVSLNAGLPLSNIEALYHDVKISKQRNVHRLIFQDGQVAMDRDFVLQWTPAGGHAPQAAVFKETIDNDDYLLMMMLPPQQKKAETTAFLPRDMIFIIDTSGSMGGSSIVQARESLALALSRLQPEDNFNVIEFDSSYTTLFPHPVAADTQNIQHAINWVSELQADGGTEMRGALHAALTQMEQTGRLQQIVFITDGAVGNEAALFKLIHQYLGDTRLFTVGIGSAPNSYFMRKAAEFGRGSFTHIGTTSEVRSRMEALFKKLESAVVSHINVQWPVAVEAYPEKVPDLYAGEPILIAARTRAAQGEIQIDGFTAESSWNKHLNIDIQGQHEGVASIWARSKVEALEDNKHRGMDAGEVREKVLAVALTHKLITRYTSFVAVEQAISRPAHEALKQSPVPNAVANGQVAQQQTLAYPQGASSSTFSFIIGFIGLILWLIYSIVNRIVK